MRGKGSRHSWRSARPCGRRREMAEPNASGVAEMTKVYDRPDLLDLPHDADLAYTLDYGRELIEDPELPTVRRWRERGGKVLGHFQVYFPEELAHAAGVLPVKVRGAQVERREADSHFGS